jgi:hypothetical protein
MARKLVQRRADGVDDAWVVAREQLEREQRRPTAGRAVVLEAAPQQLDFLAVAELADRAVRDCALAVVGRARGVLDFVLPLRAQARQATLVALLGERGGLGGGCRQLRQLRASATRGRCSEPTA